MNAVFIKIVNMSISAGWLILAVLVLRFLLKRAPKWVNVLLWGIAAVRLVLPFSIQSAWSLIPSGETIPSSIEMAPDPGIDSGIEAIDKVVNPVIGRLFTPNPAASANPLQIWIPIFAVIWLLGIAALLLYAAISYWRLRRKLSTAVLLRDNIFQSENVSFPFVLGIFRPKIYLPFKLDGQSLAYVAAHEQAHIRRGDFLWKPLGFLILTVYCFNPLMWVAYVLLCRDMELACDERVIKELSSQQRADYTQTLLTCSVQRSAFAVCPLAFGEVGVKTRVKSVMNYRKPAFWFVLFAIAACLAVAACFLTDPLPMIVNPWVREYAPGTGNIQGNVDREKYESVSEDFAIGADKNGKAVFKEPYKAFDTFVRLYSEGIAWVGKKNHLAPISPSDYIAYKTYGWQTYCDSEEMREQVLFISSFLDVYENSFPDVLPG